MKKNFQMMQKFLISNKLLISKFKSMINFHIKLKTLMVLNHNKIIINNNLAMVNLTMIHSVYKAL